MSENGTPSPPEKSSNKKPEQPRHRESGEDYPLRWAHRLELAMDEGHARALFYGGLFGAFVLVVVTIGLVCVLADTTPF